LAKKTEQTTTSIIQIGAKVGRRLGHADSTLKTYKGFPHGMPTTEADTINADLLAFLKA